MARKPRQRAENGIYHVLLRAKDKMLFVSDDDASVFLKILLEEKQSDFLEVYAYCFLNDCIHLVIKEGLGGISANIMRVKSNYSRYYNTANLSKGSLFFDRFLSEPLDEADMVLDCTRYVHQIPLSKSLTLDYEWSSYNKYFKHSQPLVNWQEIILLLNSQIDYKLYLESDFTYSYLGCPQRVYPKDFVAKNNDSVENNANLAVHKGKINNKNKVSAETDFKTKSDKISLDPNISVSYYNTFNDVKNKIVNNSNEKEDSFISSENHENKAKPEFLTKEELVVKIKELFDGVDASELDELSEEEYKILIKRIKSIKGAKIEDIAEILSLDIEYILQC